MRCEMDAGDGLADGDRDDLIRLGFAPSALGVVLDGDLEHVVEPLHERFVPASSVLKGSDDQLHSRLRVQIPFFVVIVRLSVCLSLHSIIYKYLLRIV